MRQSSSPRHIETVGRLIPIYKLLQATQGSTITESYSYGGQPTEFARRIVVHETQAALVATQLRVIT
jgi:hypothetical protein